MIRSYSNLLRGIRIWIRELIIFYHFIKSLTYLNHLPKLIKVGFGSICCGGSEIRHDFGVRLWFPVRDFRSSVVEGLCNFMARIPNKNRSIDGSKEMLKLAVRITDLWFVGTPNKSEQAEMIFVDSEGDQIHAICKSDHLKSWKADLKENCTYVMHNFKVVKNDGQFRVCEHEYKLFFIGVTVVREADLHELPFKEFRFVEFANVVASNFVSGMLVDIIRVIDQVVFRHVSSKNTRVVFRMKDLSYPASVSNSFKASKLLINHPILEIQEFKERLLDLGVEVSRVLLRGDQASSQLRLPAIRQLLILQFKASFHCDKDAIEIPGFYQRQWLPNYPEIIEFKYDGETYEIQVRQHKGKLHFADGLTRLRTELQIYESVTINFLACDHPAKFDLHFTPPLD
ncbi:hypothetical protein JHK86_022444 [Glycine max]|nr:hypothetical protein JHK86_022444 [Glycine max]